MLLDKLKQLGWAPVARRVKHTIDSEKVFDSRDPSRRKRYYQCLLNLPSALSANTEIFSDQPQSYYQLALQSVHVDIGLGGKRYKQMIRNTKLGRPLDALLQLEDKAYDDDVFDLGN